MEVASRPVHKKLRGGGYDAIHKWLKKHYGKADRCENPKCLKISNTFQWAKLPDKTYEHKRENFVRLCSQCHRFVDMTKTSIVMMANTLRKRTNPDVCRNGHPRTPENTYWAKRILTVAPVCKVCHRESQRRYVCKSRA